MTVLDDLSNGKLRNLENVRSDISFVKHDVSEPFSINGLDAIYHLACFPRSRSFQNPQRDVEVNVIGMVNVLEVAKKNSTRVVFSSNSGIYDTSRIPIDEETCDNPKTPYDLDKLQAENYLKLYKKAYGVEHVIFRFATVYGPRQNVSPEWKPVIMEFVTKLSDGRAPTIYWDGEQTRDFIYVEDLVEALILALDCEEADGETMILGTGEETSINQVYRTICSLLDTHIQPLRKPKQLGDIRQMCYNCQKARRILGWNPEVTLEEGIRRILKHPSRSLNDN